MSFSRVHCTLTGARQPIALRGRHRLDDHVGVGDGAPAEAAAGLHHVQPHLVRRACPRPGRRRLVEVGHLVPAPDLEHAVVVPPRDRVHRLQRGMGEVGELERRLDAPAPPPASAAAMSPSSRAIAAGAPPASRGTRARSSSEPRVSAALSSQSTVTRLAALDRRPGVLGDDGHAARRLDHVDDALDRLGAAGVEAT